MKTDKISFGTKPLIGDIAAHKGLRKYNARLTDGILDAFEKLSQNNVDDLLVINLGHKIGAKKDTTDALEISLWQKLKNSPCMTFKSYMVFSPRTLQKFSKKHISELILNTHKKLTKKNIETNAGVFGYPSTSSNKISAAHESKIETLTTKFGFDDWTCA